MNVKKQHSDCNSLPTEQSPTISFLGERKESVRSERIIICAHLDNRGKINLKVYEEKIQKEALSISNREFDLSA